MADVNVASMSGLGEIETARSGKRDKFRQRTTAEKVVVIRKHDP
jgi:hypothetical protein